jgi:hypothetical protein
VDPSGDFNVDDFLTELAEVGVGTAILGLRRLNIERRRLVDERPSLEPAIDAVLDQIDSLAQPVSDVLGAAVAGIGDAIEGDRGAQLTKAGQMIAEIGPEIVRLSGLTKRD